MKNTTFDKSNLEALSKHFQSNELEERLEYGWGGGGSTCYETICYENTCTGESITITQEVPCPEQTN